MSGFTKRVTKERFMFCIKYRGWVMDNEKEAFEKLYDYATTVENVELDRFLDEVTRNGFRYSTKKERIVKDIKDKISKLSLPEELSAPFMNMPEEVDDKELQKVIKGIDRRLDDEKEKVIGENAKIFNERFGGMKKKDFSDRLVLKGWGNYRDISFFMSLYKTAHDNADPESMAFMEELMNTDVTDDPEKRKAVVDKIKEFAANGYFALEGFKTVKDDAQKVKLLLEGKDLEEVKKKREEAKKRIERVDLGIRTDAIFVEKAKEMGWRDEDIPILNKITEIQNQYRGNIDGEPLEEMRQKIMQTKIDPAKYYTVRNALLREALNTSGDKRFGGRRDSYRTAMNILKEAVKNSEYMIHHESHEEKKKEFIEEAKKRGWNKPDDERILGLVFDARFNGDGKLNADYEKRLDELKKEENYDIVSKTRFLGRLSGILSRISRDDYSDAQKTVRSITRVDQNVDSIFKKSLFEPVNGFVIPAPEEIRDPRLARFYSLTTFCMGKSDNYRDWIIDAENKGFSPRIMAVVLAEKTIKIAEEAKDPAGQNENVQRYIKVVCDDMTRNQGYYADYHPTKEEEEEKKRAEEYLDGIINERMNAYTNIDPALEEQRKRERREYIESARQAGWNEPGDEELLNAFYNARYDREGNVVPRIDNIVRNPALQNGNLGVARRAWLTVLRAELNALDHGGNDTRSTAQVNAQRVIYTAINRAELIATRENMVDKCIEKGWDIDKTVFRRVFEAYIKAGKHDKSSVISELTRGRCQAYNIANVEPNGSLIHIQSFHQLQKMHEELTAMSKERYFDSYIPEMINTALNAVSEEMKKYDENVLNTERARNDSLIEEHKQHVDEAIEVYRDRLVGLKEADLDDLEKASAPLQNDSPALADLKEKAMLVAKEKEGFKAALKDPSSPDARPFMEKLYNLNKELERYEMEVTDKNNWPYSIMSFAKTVLSEHWEKYREVAEGIDRLNAKAEPHKEKILSLEYADLIKIGNLCVNPAHGQPFPEQLNLVLQWGRYVSQSRKELEAIKQQYNSLEGIRFKTRYVTVNDALARLVDEVHPNMINANTVTLLKDYFPARYEEYKTRKDIVTAHAGGKDAFVNAAVNAGWNTEEERQLIETLYNAGLDSIGKKVMVADNITYEDQLRELTAAKDNNVESLFDKYRTLYDALSEIDVENRTNSISDAILALEGRMQQLQPRLDEIQHQRELEALEISRREMWARDRMGLSPLNIHIDGLRQRRDEEIARENREMMKEDLLESHALAVKTFGNDLSSHGFSEAERTFLTELYKYSVNENGQAIKNDHNAMSLTNMIGMLAITNRENISRVSEYLTEIYDFINELPENERPQQLSDALPRLEQMKNDAREIVERREAENAVGDYYDMMIWRTKEPVASNGLRCSQELLDEILEVAKKIEGNEKISGLIDSLENYNRDHKKEDLNHKVVSSFDLIRQMHQELCSLPEDKKPQAEAVIGKLNTFLTDLSRRQSYEYAQKKNESSRFEEIEKMPFWQDNEKRSFLHLIEESQYDHNNNKIVSIAELADRCGSVDTEEKFNELLTQMKESILKVPEHERSVAQQSLVIGVNRRAYVAPPLADDDRQQVLEQRRLRDEERQRARAIKQRFEPFEDMQWVQDGDREFIERIFNARPVENAQEYDRLVESLSTTQKASYWVVSDILGQISGELKKIPAGERTETQREAIGAIDLMIGQLNALEPGWQAYKAAGYPQLNNNIIGAPAGGAANAGAPVGPELQAMNAEKVKFGIIKSNLDKVAHAYTGHTNSGEYNRMVQKLNELTEENDPDQFVRLRGELGEEARKYLDHTGLKKASHSNSEIRRKCAFLLMAYTEHPLYEHYAGEANKKRSDEYKISLNKLDSMPGVGAPAAERNRVNIQDLAHEQQIAEGGAGRAHRPHRQAGGNAPQNNVPQNAGPENNAPQNVAPGRRNN